MSLNQTVAGERIQIAFFGKRNAGKSSLINALTGQNISVVSEVAGTTTDPVKKAMELLPLGPVTLIDTPGFDDEGVLGKKRVETTVAVLNYADIGVLVTAGEQPDTQEREFLELLSRRKIPYVVVYNKKDLFDSPRAKEKNEIEVSTQTGENLDKLKEMLSILSPDRSQRQLVANLLEQGDTVVLVAPIDASAPKGRLILPQVQTLRDILDAGAVGMVCRPEQLPETLEKLAREPELVITDSQVFGQVAKMVPKHIPLTSFSILFARYKGDLETVIRGAKRLAELKDGDLVLIAEGCTHHRQCGDIGRDKLPQMICDFSGAEPKFELVSGGKFPQDVSRYALVVHCGGCMLTEQQMKNRQQSAGETPFVNFGIAIAKMNGILDRALKPFR